MHLEPTGKRIHLPQCMADDFRANREQPIGFNKWHATLCPAMGDKHSAEFPIEWINAKPEMAELEELRRGDKDYD